MFRYSVTFRILWAIKSSLHTVKLTSIKRRDNNTDTLSFELLLFRRGFKFTEQIWAASQVHIWFHCKKKISWFRDQKRNYITNKWAIIKLYNLKGLKGWNGVRNLHIMSPHAFLSSQMIMLTVFPYFRGLQISGYSPTATARTPASTLSWQVKTETGGNLKSERMKSWWKK